MSTFDRNGQPLTVGDTVKVCDSGCDDNGKLVMLTYADSGMVGWDRRGYIHKESASSMEKISSGQNHTRRTFRLKRTTPELKKGAIVQEACDDGTQDYIPLNPTEDVKYQNEKKTKAYIRMPRAAVENEPGYFEEVFPATPAWLSKDELEKQKAFVDSLSKKTKTRPAVRKQNKTSKK